MQFKERLNHSETAFRLVCYPCTITMTIKTGILTALASWPPAKQAREQRIVTRHLGSSPGRWHTFRTVPSKPEKQ
ncbi:MAG: hypothetical protein CMM01_24650 [Rhodopirellula sp.]|nr:hypothetical protein [Rhodopirellula sp.]